MTIIKTIDLETSINNTGDEAIGDMAASPHAPKNKIVYTGVQNINSDLLSGTAEVFREAIPFSISEADILVGHNIKFDLLYLMRYSTLKFKPTFRVWDTMLAEYLLSGQAAKFAKLDDLAVKYGGTLKDDRLKEFWDAGVKTEDIDPDIIIPYLEGDLNNTSLIFIEQLKEAHARGMKPLIMSQMDALLATTEMEYNGIFFDKAGALTEAAAIRNSVELAESDLRIDMSSFIFEVEANPDSNEHVSVTLFGGELPYTTRLPMYDEKGDFMRYKSGAKKGCVRYKLHKGTQATKGYEIPTSYTKEMKKKGYYQVNDEVLKNIAHSYRGRDAGNFCETLLAYRSMKKDLKTYFEGYSDLVWPHDSCIHPQFNHVQTNTGRLSHSKPNIGNVAHE